MHTHSTLTQVRTPPQHTSPPPTHNHTQADGRMGDFEGLLSRLDRLAASGSGGELEQCCGQLEGLIRGLRVPQQVRECGVYQRVCACLLGEGGGAHTHGGAECRSRCAARTGRPACPPPLSTPYWYAAAPTCVQVLQQVSGAFKPGCTVIARSSANVEDLAGLSGESWGAARTLPTHCTCTHACACCHMGPQGHISFRPSSFQAQAGL